MMMMMVMMMVIKDEDEDEDEDIVCEQNTFLRMCFLVESFCFGLVVL